MDVGCGNGKYLGVNKACLNVSRGRPGSTLSGDPDVPVGHCTGKTGKMAKANPCQGKHREFGDFSKTQGFFFVQVVNSLILKIKNIVIFAANKFFFISWIHLPSQFCVCNSHKTRKVVQGQICSMTGKTGNLNMQFEWGPCGMAYVQ